MSRAVIEVMKKRMSLEERKRFIQKLSCKEGNLVDGLTLLQLFKIHGSVIEYFAYTHRFLSSELNLTINLKELCQQKTKNRSTKKVPKVKQG